jgi:hypothetical protein
VARQRNIWKNLDLQRAPEDKGLTTGLPELALCQLLYILAHHPDFADDLDEVLIPINTLMLIISVTRILCIILIILIIILIPSPFLL